MHVTCTWMQSTMSSSTNFEANLGSVMGDQTSYLSACLKGGDGDIMNAVAGNSADVLDQLGDTIQDTNSFDSTKKLDLIT